MLPCHEPDSLLRMAQSRFEQRCDTIATKIEEIAAEVLLQVSKNERDLPVCNRNERDQKIWKGVQKVKGVPEDLAERIREVGKCERTSCVPGAASGLPKKGIEPDTLQYLKAEFLAWNNDLIKYGYLPKGSEAKKGARAVKKLFE